MAKKPPLNKVLNGLPNPPNTETVLPGTHLSIARWFKDTADAASIEPRKCRVFSERLIYLFYGGIFYRPGRGPTRDAINLPVAFVFSPLVFNAKVRYFPFDTGAMENGLYGRWKSQFPDFKDSLRVRGRRRYEAVRKLVYHLFGNNSNYLRGQSDSACASKPSPIRELYDFYNDDLTKFGVDQRQCCVECQFTEPIKFDYKLLWVGFPEAMKDEFVKLCIKISPHKPDGYAYRSHVIYDPNEIAAELDSAARKIINRYEKIL